VRSVRSPSPRRHGSPRRAGRPSVLGFQLDDRSHPQIEEMFEENASEAIHRWTGHQGEVQGLEAKLDQMWQRIEEMRQDQLNLQHSSSAAIYRSPMPGQQTVGFAFGVPDWHESPPQQYGYLRGASDGRPPRSNSMAQFPSTSMAPLAGNAPSRTSSAPVGATPARRQPWAESSYSPYGGISLTSAARHVYGAPPSAVQKSPPTADEKVHFQHETHFALSDASELSAQERFTSQTRRVHSPPKQRPTTSVGVSRVVACEDDFVAGRWSAEALAIIAQRKAEATAYKVGTDTRQDAHVSGLRSRPRSPRSKRTSSGGGDEILSEFTDAGSAHRPVVWSPVRDALSSGQALPSTLDRELCEVATRGDVHSGKALLHFGADKDARNSAGAPAAWLAAANGHSAVLAELAAAGADLHARDPSGHTALTVACVNGHAQCVSLLLWQGVDFEALTKGFTPLMYAAWQGWANCAELLLRAGAAPMRTNSDGHTALDLAQQHRHAGVVSLLSLCIAGRSSPVQSHTRAGITGVGDFAFGEASTSQQTRAHVPLVEEGTPPPPAHRW
jgi:hypothetical protein